jgi:hypothetical protein
MGPLFNLLWKTANVRLTTDKRQTFRAGIQLLAVALLCLAGLGVEASAQTWSLTNTQRQAYLNYYAPIILKRADENNNKQGRDWITNFDFDQDGNFSNNRVNWLNVPQYVNASATGPNATYDRWRIRPTLYTSLIEYMENGSKSVVLLYHIYNATDKDGSGIHDWERVEILVRAVNGTPGSGSEYVNHVTSTMHKEQLMRRYYDAGGLNFMQTATGKHILIWQADESDWDWITGTSYGYHAHALWQVKTPYSTIAALMNSVNDAQVDLPETDTKNVHYIFVPEGSQAAVDTWNAKPLTYTTASNLASRVDNGDRVRWYQTKRITYELQDIADILPTHAQSNAWNIHWLSKKFLDVLMESPIINEAGQAETLTGLQRFNVFTRDSGKSNYEGADEAFMYKRAFTGTYSAELNSELSITDGQPTFDGDAFPGYEGFGVDDYGRTRGAASGYVNSHNSFWWQHDFFVHSGVITSNQTNYEAGIWLPGAWYTQANGGFDGRWVQLFADRAGQETFSPLTLSVSHPSKRCIDPFYVTAIATGGLSPYTFTWVNTTPLSPPSAPTNLAEMTAGQGSVTVQSADGQTRTYSIRVPINCGGGGGGGQIP